MGILRQRPLDAKVVGDESSLAERDRLDDRHQTADDRRRRPIVVADV
jgi:hypothetical protein